MKPIRLRRFAARGVVLLEVLVAILIFSFGILGTVGLLARAVQFSNNAEDRNRAALLANEMSSAMWARGTNDVANAALAGDYAAWRGRVALVTAAGTSNTTTSGLPNGVGTVTGPVAGVSTITLTWRAPNSTSDNQYVTQVVVP